MLAETGLDLRQVLSHLPYLRGASPNSPGAPVSVSPLVRSAFPAHLLSLLAGLEAANLVGRGLLERAHSGPLAG